MITYIAKTQKGYISGNKPTLQEAVYEAVERGSLESYYFHGNVEEGLKKVGLKKMMNLVRIIEEHNLGK
jgi:hypothetical protein